MSVRIGSVGILGAGKVGTAIARQAVHAGMGVQIATAKPAEELAMLVEFAAPGAVAVDAANIPQSDLVIVAVPLAKYRTLHTDALAGKTVIDAMNYWAPTDGELSDFENDPRSTSEVVQAYLAGANLVKALNHIGYHDMDEDGREPGMADRRALAFAGGDDLAKSIVAEFVDRIGFDAVDAGPLAAGRAFQPGTPIFTGSHNERELRELLDRARELVA